MTLQGLFAGLLAAVVLTRLRLRPDHRLRAIVEQSDRDVGPARFVGRRPASFRFLLRRAPRRPGPTELAGWCDTLARDLRSGATLGSALRARPAPHGSVFADLAQRLGRGVPIVDAVRGDGGSTDEQAIAAVLAACANAGGPAAEPIDRVAATLRRRAADDAERLVQSSQARLSARVMTVIPLAVLALLLTTSAPVRGSVGTPIGVMTVSVGLVLNVVGWRWMRRVIGGRR